MSMSESMENGDQGDCQERRHYNNRFSRRGFFARIAGRVENTREQQLMTLRPQLSPNNLTLSSRSVPCPDRYQMEVTGQRDHRCPCGCPGPNFYEERDSIRMRTKEVVNSAGCGSGSGPEMVDRTFGFEVLRYQGHHFGPEDIATVWKKDCRSWLWKSKDKPRRTAVEKELRCS